MRKIKQEIRKEGKREIKEKKSNKMIKTKRHRGIAEEKEGERRERKKNYFASL